MAKKRREKSAIVKLEFDRLDHVYRLPPEFDELIKDAIRFFNGTPVYPFPLPKFTGPGVYAIYCIAKKGIYKHFHEVNRTDYRTPIYVGKAVPSGWRKGRSQSSSTGTLCNRLNEHRRGIDRCQNVELTDFQCRFIIMEDEASDLISALEASLIREYNPLWNTVVDGFGNHTPGEGRFDQAKSDWDVIHPGRTWAEKCRGKSTSKRTVLAHVRKYMEGIVS